MVQPRAQCMDERSAWRVHAASGGCTDGVLSRAEALKGERVCTHLG